MRSLFIYTFFNEQFQIMGVDDTEIEDVYKDNLEGFF